MNLRGSQSVYIHFFSTVKNPREFIRNNGKLADQVLVQAALSVSCAFGVKLICNHFLEENICC